VRKRGPIPLDPRQPVRHACRLSLEVGLGVRGPASPVRVRPPLPMCPGAPLPLRCQRRFPGGQCRNRPGCRIQRHLGRWHRRRRGSAPPSLCYACATGPRRRRVGTPEPRGSVAPSLPFYPALTGSASSCRTVYCSPWLRPGGIVATYIRFHMTTWLQPAYYVPMATPRVPRGYLVAPSVAPCS